LLLPPYEPFFRTLRNHLPGEAPLPPDPGQARDFLAREVTEGELFISLGDVDAAAHFRYAVVSDRRSVAGMGAEVPFVSGQVLRAGFWADGEDPQPDPRVMYRVIRNGEESAWVLGPKLSWTVPRPGIYRVEVYRYSARLGETVFRLRPWIFSNPIGVLGPGDGSGG
jgi:hypothetical protein